MIRLLSTGRAAALLLLSVFLTACNQTTSVSTYGGSLGTQASGATASRAKISQAKIERAREKARLAKIKRKKDFEAKRKEEREARRERSAAKSEKTGKSRTAKKAAEKLKKSPRKTARSAAKAKLKTKALRAKLKRQKATKKSAKAAKRNEKAAKRNKKVATVRTVKGKVNRVKTSTSAFVGGRSKGITKSAPWKCVPGQLKGVINQISKKYGRVVVNSTHRSKSHNRKVGGKRGSYHLGCKAVDFRVHGNTKGLTRWLARHPQVGGYKRYASGFYHIDTGPKRSW